MLLAVAKKDPYFNVLATDFNINQSGELHVAALVCGVLTGLGFRK